jgi:superfamily II DNA or RNA helicase
MMEIGKAGRRIGICSMIKLRDYQQALADTITAAWLTARSVLAVLSTGGGKTVIFSSLIHEHNGASAAVVHRKEIVGQISCALAGLEVKHRVIAPPNVIALIRRKHLKRFGKSFVDPHAQCGVISVQSVTSKASLKDPALQRWLAQITLCVFDEGHHYVTQGIWGRAVRMMDRAKLLFVTATPERADGKGLGVDSDGFCEMMVEGPATAWLIVQGYLSRFIYKAPQTDLDMSDLPITASGEVNAKELRARTVKSHLVGDVVKHYLQFARGKKTIVFASDVATAEEMAASFRQAGINTFALSGETDSTTRDRRLDEFEFGDLDVLVNVDLFDEGFDVPAVECVILARITMSLAKYLQMCGRGLRVVYAEGYDLKTQAGRLAAIAAGTKRNAIIIDPVRNWERHGMPNWPRKWTLDARSKGTRAGAADTIPQRVCLACTQPYEAFYKACPHCGEPVPLPGGRSLPEQVDGDLMELDVEGMAALFAKINGADMDYDEYLLDQISRNIPPIGRGADMKRHQAAKYRRSVLHELVGWWIGMQPDGRELGEKHRRFYHRFGIDIGTAFTLGANDTDALIERIQQRFAEDMV